VRGGGPRGHQHVWREQAVAAVPARPHQLEQQQESVQQQANTGTAGGAHGWSAGLQMLSIREPDNHSSSSSGSSSSCCCSSSSSSSDVEHRSSVWCGVAAAQGGRRERVAGWLQQQEQDCGALLGGSSSNCPRNDSGAARVVRWCDIGCGCHCQINVHAEMLNALSLKA